MALTTAPETPLSLHQRQPMCVGPDHFYRFSRSRPEMGCRGVNSMIWRRLVMQDDIGTWSLPLRSPERTDRLAQCKHREL